MPIAKASTKGKEHAARNVLLAHELSDAEMEMIRAAKVEAATYTLDEIDEEGNVVRKPLDRAR